MNIRRGPQVRGRGTFIRRGIGSPRNRGAIQRARIDFDSSSSSEINSDIPTLDALQHPKTTVLLRSESSYSSDNENAYDKNESLKKDTKISSNSQYESYSNENKANWLPNQSGINKTTVINRNQQLNKNVSKKDASYEYSDEYTESNSLQNNIVIKKSNSRPLPENRAKTSVNIEVNHISKSNSYQQSQEKSKNDVQLGTNSNLNEYQTPNQNVLSNDSNNAIQDNNVLSNGNNALNNNNNALNNGNNVLNNNNNNDNNNNNNSAVESTEVNESNELNSQPIENELLSLTILHEKSTFLKKETFKILQKNKIIYNSMEGKDNIGHYTILSSSTTFNIGDSSYKGLVRYNSKGNKYLIISDEMKPHDDREGEICGISFKSSNAGKSKTKTATIVLPLSTKPYYSISKRLSLTSFASGETEMPPNFIKFNSKLPEVDKKGKSSLDLGEFYLIPSSKNIIICNEKGEDVFIFYKINDGSYKVHIAPPITPIIAFGICISILKSF